MILVSQIHEDFPSEIPVLLDQYVIRDFTTAESYGAISDEVCTVINESSRTALEYALCCEYSAKKTVKSLKARY